MNALGRCEAKRKAFKTAFLFCCLLEQKTVRLPKKKERLV